MLSLDLMRSGRAHLLSSGRFVSLRSSVHPRRTLDHFVLLVGIDGKSRIAHDGREYVLEEGSYLLLFPEREHGGVAPTEGKQSHFWCHFRVEDAVIGEGDAGGIAEYGRLPSNDKYKLLFCQLIDAEYGSHGDKALHRRVCDAYTEAILGELVSDLCAQQGERSRGKRMVASVREWIRLHAGEALTAGSVAREFGYHPDYLSGVFRKETGRTLCAYIGEVRIERAKKLLLTTNLHVKEIAREVGFEDERYFMRAFRKRTGMRASEFRNTYFHLHVNSNEGAGES